MNELMKSPFNMAAEAQKIREEASHTSVCEAVLRHLRQTAALQPEGRFRDGRTAEESLSRLMEGMNSMAAAESFSGQSLKETLARIIAEQKMDSVQSRQYVALVGVMLEEMTGDAGWTDSAHAREAVERKFRARVGRYANLPLDEQIDRLAAEAWPDLEPAAAHLCHLSLVREILRPVSQSRQDEAVRQLAEFCSERENALIIAALNYEQTVTGDRPFSEQLDPAFFAVSAAYGLSATKACALEFSGEISSPDAEDLISDAQDCCCKGAACLLGTILFAASVYGMVVLSDFVEAQLESELAGLLMLSLGYSASLALAFGAVCLGISLFTDFAAAWNTAKNLRRLSAETETDISNPSVGLLPLAAEEEETEIV